MGIAPKNPKQPAWSFGTLPGQAMTKPKEGLALPAPLTIEDRLKRIISITFGIDEKDIVPNAHLIHDLDMDSLDLVELSMVCEEEFGFEFGEQDNWIPFEMLTISKWLRAIQYFTSL